MTGAAPLTLALPRGRPWATLAPLLVAAGVPGAAEADPERQLVYQASGTRLIFTRPADVVTYVREGVADAGITGRDVLAEDPAGLVELADVALGNWRMSVAVPATGPGLEQLIAERGDGLRVATSYPRQAAAYFAAAGTSVHLVRLRGAVELAAVTGLADAIVDMVDTGRTLAAHGLVEAAVISAVSLRLVANPVRLRYAAGPIAALTAALQRVRQHPAGPQRQGDD